MTNITPFNISQLHFNNSPPTITEIDIKDLACISLDKWVLDTGIVILALYLVISVGAKLLYMRYPSDKMLYWIEFARTRYIMVCVGYIALIVFLAYNGKV